MRKFAAAVAASLALSSAWAGVGAWTPLPNPPGSGIIYVLDKHPTNPLVRYAASQGGVYVSVDGGASWTQRNSGIVPTPAGYYTVNDLAIAGSAIYIAPNFLQKSIDGGNSWQRTGWVTENPFAVKLAVTPGNSNVVYAGANRGVYKSTDGGATFNWLDGSRETRALAVDPNNANVVFRAVDTGIWRSLDGGATWAQVSATLKNIVDFTVDPNNGSIVYALTLASGVQKSIDRGSTWTAINRCLPNKCVPATLNDAWPKVLIVQPGNSSVLYLGTSSGGLYKSTDGGANWMQAHNGPIGVTTMILDPVNADTIVAANGGDVYMYTFPATAQSDWERLFAWAQATYPQYFAPACSNCTVSAESLHARYYAGTGNYLWTLGNDVYVYGTVFGGLLRVGALADFMPAVVSAGY